MINAGIVFRFKKPQIREKYPEIFQVNSRCNNGYYDVSNTTGSDRLSFCIPLCEDDIERLTLAQIIEFLETNNKTETNMERNLKLTIEQAQKLYEEQPTMRELLLTSFTKEELEGVVLRYWVEIGEKSGFYIGSDSMIYSHLGGKNIAEFNVFATKAQAKSALAMAQLSQLMKDLGDECDVDWGSKGERKFIIIRYNHDIIADVCTGYYCFLAFKTEKVRDAFLKKHEQLIKNYLMI